MTTCEQYREWISAALDGELSDGQQKELNAHLEVCPDCRAMAEAFQNLSALISEGQEEPPEELKRRVMDNIRSPGTRFPKKYRRILFSAAATAACVALVITVSPAFRGVSSAKSAETPMNFSITSDSAATEECEELPAEKAEAFEEENAMIPQQKSESADVIYDNTLTTAEEMHCRSVILISGELPFSPAEEGAEYITDSAPYIIRISQKLAEELMDSGLYEYSEDFSAENDICLVLHTPAE